MACKDEHEHDPQQCEGPEHPDIISGSTMRLEFTTVPTNNEDLARWAASLPRASEDEVEELRTLLGEQGELEELVRFRKGVDGIIPEPTLPRAATREARDAFVAYLEFEQEFAATGSRDFGRGMAHAINLLRRAPAECYCCPLPLEFPVGQWTSCPGCGRRWYHDSEKSWTTRKK